VAATDSQRVIGDLALFLEIDSVSDTQGVSRTVCDLSSRHGGRQLCHRPE